MNFLAPFRSHIPVLSLFQDEEGNEDNSENVILSWFTIHSFYEVRTCFRYHKEPGNLDIILGANIDPATFRKIMHIHRETFYHLCDYLKQPRSDGTQSVYYDYFGPQFKPRYHSYQLAVACGIFALAQCGTYHLLASAFNMPTSTFIFFSKMFNREMVKRKNEHIYFPIPQSQKQLSGRFGIMNGAVFALDGTHIKRRTNDKTHACFSYKGMATINIQVMCDADRNVVYISPCFTGRTHDSTCLKNSSIYPHLNSSCPFFLKDHCYILADQGYACTGKVVRPFSKRFLTTQKRVLFNEWHKSCRLIVEDVMKDVKHRCYSFHYGCRSRDFDECSDQIYAAFVLHMFAKRHEAVIFRKENHATPFEVPTSFHNLTGADLRDAICQYLSRNSHYNVY